MLRSSVPAALCLFIGLAVARANFTASQVSNNTVPASGDLLDGSATFLRDDSNGKLLAR